MLALDQVLEWSLLLLLQKGKILPQASILDMVLIIKKGKRDPNVLFVESWDIQLTSVTKSMDFQLGLSSRT